jgi:hypothetical protein
MHEKTQVRGELLWGFGQDFWAALVEKAIGSHLNN